MNGTTLDDVMKVAGSINPLLVILLLVVTTVGAVAMIALCSGGLMVVKKLLQRIFGKDDQ